MLISKNLEVWCFFSSRLDRFKITCTSIRKLHSKPLFYSKFYFLHFEPQNCEVIENSFKAHLTLVH